VREEPVPMQGPGDERDWRMNVRRGIEAIEGEVAMDELGDGYINIAKVISCIFYILYVG
jgi:cleavage and polyadenylation specificity factor subunit 1